jgi:hypothetical protein
MDARSTDARPQLFAPRLLIPVCGKEGGGKVLKLAKMAKMAKMANISGTGSGGIFSRGGPQTRHLGEDSPADKPGIQKGDHL